jgi:hypothetical protein
MLEILLKTAKTIIIYPAEFSLSAKNCNIVSPPVSDKLAENQSARS